jgi:hypothetical protein
MTVEEMLTRISSSELTEWLAVFSLEANPPKPKQTPDDVRAVLGSMVRR